MNTATIENYKKVMEFIGDYKEDANACIAKRKAKLTGDKVRDSRLMKSIEGFKSVLDFDGTDDYDLMVSIAPLVSDINTFDHGNASKFQAQLKMNKSNKY